MFSLRGGSREKQPPTFTMCSFLAMAIATLNLSEIPGHYDPDKKNYSINPLYTGNHLGQSIFIS